MPTLDALDLEPHRPALIGHCYRMLGSAFDAEDAVQETMVRAWKSLERFDGRSSLRTWLYRIATNVCLDALSQRGRRARPMEEGPVHTTSDTLEVRPRTHWLEPIPDALAVPAGANADPGEIAMLRQSIRLAFVAALQHLPAKQRAALVLTEVLGWSASEVAGCLDTSVAAVNSALQRARATLADRDIRVTADALSTPQRALLDRYVDAFLRYEVDTLVSMLKEDAVLSMPPYTMWLQGRADIREWLLGRGSGCRGSRLIPTGACGMPAFGQYRPTDDPALWKPWAIVVLELDGERIARWNSFLDADHLFPLFGLPLELTA